MAKLRFKCACGKTLAVDEQFAGRIARCPACRRPVQVPEAGAAPQAERKDADASEQIASLADAYGTVVQTKARRKRADAALREYAQRTRKRILILAACAVAVAIAGLIAYRSMHSYGPSVRPDQCPPGTADCRDGLCARDPAMRAAATWEFADLGGTAATWIVGLMAQSPEELVRIVAIRALERTDRTQGPRYIEEQLRNGDLNVRMTAAFALVRCAGHAPGLAALKPHLARALEADPDALAWLERASGETPPSKATLDWLERRRTSRRASDRMSAAWLIAALLGPDESLFGLLRDPDARVAVSAVDAAAPFLTAEEFARLRKKEDGQDEWRQRYVVLANVARQLRHADLEVRRAAALALAPSAQESQAALFERALQDKDWFVRFAAFKGLSYISPTAALKVIADSGIDQAAENEPNRRVLLRIQDAARPAEKPGGQP